MLDKFTKNDGGKSRFSLIPLDSLLEINAVLDFGARKYDDHNWAKSESISRYYDACMRHLMAWFSGQDNDPETGLNHLAHAGCCILFLLAIHKRGTAIDDRPNLSPKAPE